MTNFVVCAACHKIISANQGGWCDEHKHLAPTMQTTDKSALARWADCPIHAKVRAIPGKITVAGFRLYLAGERETDAPMRLMLEQLSPNQAQELVLAIGAAQKYNGNPNFLFDLVFTGADIEPETI